MAFAGFTGTVLLFQQNKRIDTQNELIGVTLASELRQRLVASKGETKLGPRIAAEVPGCDVSIDWVGRYDFYQHPNESVVSSIVILDKNPSIGDRVIAALEALL